MSRKLKVIVTKIRRQTLTAPALRMFCTVCEREVEILTPDNAAGILQIEEQALARLVYDGKVHVVQTVNGNLWICKDSLSKRAGK